MLLKVVDSESADCILHVSCRPVPHSLYDYNGAEICLIVKDRQGMHSSPVLTSIIPQPP